MRKISVACALLLLGSTISSDGQALRPQAPVEVVSLVQLIATPERFDGRLVAVTGYLHLEFEGEALYLHKEDSDQSIIKNALWVEGNPVLENLRSSLDMHYVRVVGNFHSAYKGLYSAASGSLTDITTAGRWPPVVVQQER